MGGGCREIEPEAPQREQLQREDLERFFVLSYLTLLSYLDFERRDIASNNVTIKNAVTKLIIAEHAIISRTVLGSNKTELRDAVITNPTIFNANSSSANAQCRRSIEKFTT